MRFLVFCEEYNVKIVFYMIRGTGNPSKIKQINANSMLEKMMHESGNMLQKGAQMGATIEKILIKMKVQKYMDFLSTRRAVDGRPGTHGADLGGSLLVCFNIPTVRH